MENRHQIANLNVDNRDITIENHALVQVTPNR